MRFFVTVLIALSLLVLVFVLIIKGFSNHPSQTVPQPLTSYAATDTSMQFVISGPVSADQTHQAITMNISQTQAQINIIQGYQGQIINSKNFTNNESAYLNFLSALQLAEFTKGTSNLYTTADLGACSFGDRYNLQIINGTGQTIQNFWADSCSNRDGTFKGLLNTVEQLFFAQIPNYGDLTSSVDI
ncbi:MAG TPA: hypothetical protein VMR08_02020 [Patescibacteria group bacterium]|jgi:hypothetical protein|nr:hypothetical protein [Patescibacteria group bacterium]